MELTNFLLSLPPYCCLNAKQCIYWIQIAQYGVQVKWWWNSIQFCWCASWQFYRLYQQKRAMKFKITCKRNEVKRKWYQINNDFMQINANSLDGLLIRVKIYMYIRIKWFHAFCVSIFFIHVINGIDFVQTWKISMKSEIYNQLPSVVGVCVCALPMNVTFTSSR